MRGYMNDVGQKEILDAQAQYPEDYYHALVGPSWGKFPHNSFDGGHRKFLFIYLNILINYG